MTAEVPSNGGLPPEIHFEGSFYVPVTSRDQAVAKIKKVLETGTPVATHLFETIADTVSVIGYEMGVQEEDYALAFPISASHFPGLEGSEIVFGLERIPKSPEREREETAWIVIEDDNSDRYIDLIRDESGRVSEVKPMSSEDIAAILRSTHAFLTTYEAPNAS